MKRTLLNNITGLMIAGVAALLWVPASAHHSWSSEYLEHETVSIEGQLVEVQLRNPHSVMTILVKDDRGRVQTLTAEWVGTGRLERDGIARDQFKPGDYLILSGSPGRRPEDRKLHLKGIHRPADGWKWGRT